MPDSLEAATPQLRRAYGILKAVGLAAERFLASAEWEGHVAEVLAELGAVTDVSRIYVFQNHRGPEGELLGSQRFEWVAAGVQPQIDNPELQSLPYQAAGFGRWEEVFAGGQVVRGHVGNLPNGERDLLAAQGILSVLVCPIFAGTEWWGFIGFDACAEQRDWTDPEVDALRAAAGILGASIARERSDLALRQAQKMELVGQVTGGMAHDFNNLLTVILANADLLAADTSGKDAREELESLRGAALRGRALVAKLMGFARRSILELKPVDLNAVVDDVTQMLRRLLPESISLAVFRGDGMSKVRADVGAVEQILLNLATNARDAMPGGGTLRIEVYRTHLDRAAYGWIVPGDYVCLAVGDTGVGMDEAVRRRIFEPFFTTKITGRGTGLGMAMVYGLMKQHGGYVNVYSEPGRGTTVKTYFPHAQTGDQAAPGVSATPALRPGTGTVLVVEDEAELRRVAQRVLERAGYTVLVAADGESGLTTYRRHRGAVDLILTDVVMPGMGGKALLDAVRAEGGDVPFLFASGYTASDVRESVLLGQDLPFLHKPWSMQDLLVAVGDVLEKSRSA